MVRSTHSILHNGPSSTITTAPTRLLTRILPYMSFQHLLIIKLYCARRHIDGKGAPIGKGASMALLTSSWPRRSPQAGRAGLGATSRDCAPTPTGPVKSESAEVARPAPLAEMVVCASRQTLVPDGLPVQVNGELRV